MNLTSSPAFSHLPTSPNRLIGRDRELEAITTQLESSEVRLLTLLGMAGVGKTRLALSTVQALQSAFEYGVYFVSLASIREVNLVSAAIAHSLGLQAIGNISLPETLKRYLRERQVCLVLDNFEQLIKAASQLAELLSECPNLKLLVTSRVRLQLRWERTLLVTPLELPSSTRDSSQLTTLSETPAIKLFIERVRAITPSFALTHKNAPAVIKLCELLDGLPLALELAAAHANVLTPEGMIARWQYHLPSLGWNASDLPPRQRTLRDAIAWSYELLSKSEQTLFRQLGVFMGGFTLGAAEVVSQHKNSLESLTSLVNASLVKVSHTEHGQQRFYLLESLRDYACEQLEIFGELGATQRSHAFYFADFTKRAAPALKREGQLEWFSSLEQERDNFRAALSWANNHSEIELLINLFSDLSYFWWTKGYLHEGQQWLEKVLGGSSKKPATLRLQALGAAGLLTGTLGEYDTAKAQLGEALTLARGLNDKDKCLAVLSNLMMVSWLSGKREDTQKFADEFETWRENADTWTVAFALHCLGLLADESEAQNAKDYLEEALALFREVKDDYRAVAVMSTLAAATYNRGDSERARGLAIEALELGKQLHNQRTIVFASDILLFVASKSTTSSSHLATLLGAMDTLRTKISFYRPPKMFEHYQALVTKLQAALGKDDYETSWTAGRTMTLEALVTALLELEQTILVKKSTILSPREREVLELVAKGLSNKKIAKELDISPSTINFHLTSIFNKLEVNSRAEAVAVAVERVLL